MNNKKVFPLLFAAAMVIFAACSDDDDFMRDDDNNGGGGTVSSGSNSATIDVPDIEFDYSFLDEGTENVPDDDNDYVENSTFSHSVYVVYDGSTATVTDADGAVTTTVSGAHVTVTSTTKQVEYILSGSSEDAEFKIYSDYKMKITLDGVTITNPEGAAINDQCGKSMYLVLADGTVSTLTDGTSYTSVDEEDMKGTLFSEGQIIVSGSGALNINANCKNAIASDDYIVFRPGNVINITSAASNGVKANDGVTIRGGVLNIGVDAEGSKGINSEGFVSIEGGRTTVITSGDAEVDDGEAKGAAGIKSDSTFTMTDGELNILSSGAGGKGINCDMDINIAGGEVNIVTTGSEFTGGDGASPKGIKAEGDLTISGGEIAITCARGDGAEGIESKSTLTVSGGDIVVNAYDDAFNAEDRINISGGNIFANSIDNDGIDSNGSLYISGGVVIALGTGTPEGPFDCDNSTFAITGGSVIGFGGESSVPTTSATKQPVILLGGKSYSEDEYIALCNSSGDAIFSFKMPRSYSSSVLVVSSPSMTVGSSYTIKSGVSVSGGSSWQGFSSDATVSGGSTLQSVSVSSYVTTAGTTNSSTGLGGMNSHGFGGRW